MTIIHRDDECFVQECPECGTIFKFSLSDIIKRDTMVTTKKYPCGVSMMSDWVPCPYCGDICSPTRKTYCLDE